MKDNIRLTYFSASSFCALALLCVVQLISDLLMWQPHASAINFNLAANVIMAAAICVMAYGAWTGSKTYFRTWLAASLAVLQLIDSYFYVSREPFSGFGRLAFDLLFVAIVAALFFGPQTNALLLRAGIVSNA